MFLNAPWLNRVLKTYSVLKLELITINLEKAKKKQLFFLRLFQMQNPQKFYSGRTFRMTGFLSVQFRKSGKFMRKARLKFLRNTAL